MGLTLPGHATAFVGCSGCRTFKGLFPPFAPHDGVAGPKSRARSAHGCETVRLCDSPIANKNRDALALERISSPEGGHAIWGVEQ